MPLMSMDRSTSETRATIAELQAEHSALDQRLATLLNRLHLTNEEDEEVRRIKRRKLRNKDLIALLRARTQSQAVGAEA